MAQGSPKKLLGCPVVVDPTLPEGTIELRGRTRVRMIHVGPTWDQLAQDIIQWVENGGSNECTKVESNSTKGDTSKV